MKLEDSGNPFANLTPHEKDNIKINLSFLTLIIQSILLIFFTDFIDFGITVIICIGTVINFFYLAYVSNRENNESFLTYTIPYLCGGIVYICMDCFVGEISAILSLIGWFVGILEYNFNKKLQILREEIQNIKNSI